MGGLRGTTRVVTFVRLGILARLLTPFQFGLFGIASLVLALLETLTDTGVNVFFIQKEGELKDYIDTAWMVSILRGILISLVLFAGAGVISSFFHSVESAYLIRLIALASFLRGFISPAIVKYKKELEFNKEFILRISTALLDVAVSIIVALVTKSAVSLVWGMIAGVIVEVVISHWIISPKPKLSLDGLKFKKVINRGKWVTLAGVFQYLFSNGDNIVVGRIMDTTFLGFYQMAYRISTIPITEISDVFGLVTFPIYSKISDDKKALAKLFTKSLLLLSLVVVPAGALIFFFTDFVVNVIAGPNWAVIVPVLKVLSIFGVVRAFEGSIPPLFLALKKQEYVSAITFVSIIGLGVSIVPLVFRFGILGASYSALFGTLLSFPVAIWYLKKVFK